MISFCYQNDYIFACAKNSVTSWLDNHFTFFLEYKHAIESVVF